MKHEEISRMVDGLVVRLIQVHSEASRPEGLGKFKAELTFPVSMIKELETMTGLHENGHVTMDLLLSALITEGIRDRMNKLVLKTYTGKPQ